MEKYTLSVHVAAPGTPLAVGGGATSLPGHMYYSISDGKDTHSFGFAPVEHGDINGPGKVYRTDLEQYQNPRYTRTMEISSQQFKELKEFGLDPAAKGFDLQYRDARNNCVDFTWGALNRAGIHHTVDGKADRTHEGSLKPLRNIDDVQSIPDPIKGSPLNKEHFNAMPPRDIWQRMLSEQATTVGGEAVAATAITPRHPGHPDHALFSGIEKAVRALDEQHGRTFDATSERISGCLLALAKEERFASVEHVLLSCAGDGHPAGDTIFIVDGRPGDPVTRRAHMPTSEAASTLLETSFQRVELANVQQQTEALAQQPQLEVHQQEMSRRQV